MKMIYIGKPCTEFNGLFDRQFETDEEALKYIRHTYKSGTSYFYIDTMTDDLLKEIKALHDGGKMKHIKLKIHKANGDYDFVNSNSSWMEPISIRKEYKTLYDRNN